MQIKSTRVVGGGHINRDGTEYGRHLVAQTSDGTSEYKITAHGVVRIANNRWFFSFRVVSDDAVNTRNLQHAYDYVGA